MAEGDYGGAKAQFAGRARFYKSVSVARADGTFRLLLDGMAVRTPAKQEFLLPKRALADAIAAEWAGQGARVDPATMPLTRLANSTIDAVIGREALVRADIATYAGSDLLCYRAEGPQELVRRQSAAWDPVLAWAGEALGVRLKVTEGVMPVAQTDAAVASIARALEGYGAFHLTALHVMTSLMGSVLLALGHAEGRLSSETAWAAAHVDEDWQISQWGEDEEAKIQRARRWLEMQAATLFLELATTAN